MQTTDKIIKFPTAPCEMREAKKLVNEWGRIQQIKDETQKVVELVRWRKAMVRHLEVF